MSSSANVRTDQQRFSHAVRINRSAIALFSAWSDLARRPSELLRRCRIASDEQQGKALIKAPCIGEPSALLVDQIPGVFIAWQSLPHARIRENGEVWFHQTPNADATDVRITLCWEPDEGSDNESGATIEQIRARLAQILDGFRRLMEH